MIPFSGQQYAHLGQEPPLQENKLFKLANHSALEQTFVCSHLFSRLSLSPLISKELLHKTGSFQSDVHIEISTLNSPVPDTEYLLVFPLWLHH